METKDGYILTINEAGKWVIRFTVLPLLYMSENVHNKNLNGGKRHLLRVGGPQGAQRPHLGWLALGLSAWVRPRLAFHDNFNYKARPCLGGSLGSGPAGAPQN